MYSKLLHNLTITDKYNVSPSILHILQSKEVKDSYRTLTEIKQQNLHNSPITSLTQNAIIRIIPSEPTHTSPLSNPLPLLQKPSPHPPDPSTLAIQQPPSGDSAIRSLAPRPVQLSVRA